MCCTWLLTFICLALCGHFGTTVKLIPVDEENWWQNEVFYQIYPRSFKDSDGDGIGDLKGLTTKLQYLRDTGITATWMSPIFQSPMVDFGYDISDYKQIQPEYGTLEDFDALIAEANRLGIKMILDFVPNHSSDKHEWFAKSVAREPGYEDFYVWEDGKMENGVRSPPNNWVSVFDGSAWQWHETRQQYYLRQFTAGQPDLNYRNPRVVDAMDDILIYWLNRGVSGFRIDAVIYIYEDEQLRDEPLSGTTNDPNSVDYLTHIYTRNQPEDATIIQHWRKLLDDYSEKNTGVSRIMMTEGYSDLKTLMNFYVDSKGVEGSHFPFNFYFITDVTRNSDALDFIYFIEKWLTYMPKGHVANWVMGNHDNPRIGSRFDERAIDAMNMIMMTLPGVGVTYNGEEIGMVDYRNISWEDTVDEPACQAGMDRYQIVSRDPERTPFQWNDDANAGFSTAQKTWLSVNPNYRTLNLRQQQQADRSHYKVYTSLIALKKSKAVLRDGAFIAEALSSQVLIYKRRLKGHHSIATIVNVSGNQQTVDASNFIGLPKVTVLVAGVDSNYTPGGRLKSSYISLAPYEGLVLKL